MEHGTSVASNRAAETSGLTGSSALVVSHSVHPPHPLEGDVCTPDEADQRAKSAVNDCLPVAKQTEVSNVWRYCLLHRVPQAALPKAQDFLSDVVIDF